MTWTPEDHQRHADQSLRELRRALAGAILAPTTSKSRTEYVAAGQWARDLVSAIDHGAMPKEWTR